MSENSVNESKPDRFIRLGEYRVNKAVETINRLENLSNHNSYEYTEEQVETMFSVIEDRLMAIKGKFTVRKQEISSFSFDKKAD